jgi:hypothetical protein
MGTKALAVVSVLLLVSLSGCSFLAGPLEFSANKATIADAAVEDAGYEEVAVTEDVIEREFSRAGVTKQVRVTNWMAMYERSIDLGALGTQRAAVVSILSTPKIEIAGQGPFNPVGDYSNADLVTLVQDQYEGLSDLQQVEDRRVSILGQTATVSKYSATATLDGGAEVDVYLHVTKVEHGDDYVIAVAVHPQALPNAQQRVDAMLQNVQHEA